MEKEIEKKKGDLSLDMMVQFAIVLLVVLSVSVAVYRFVPDDPPNGGGTMPETAIENNCQEYCINYQTASNREKRLESAVNYCSERFAADITGDDQLGMVEQGHMSYCEDGIRCFHVDECSRGNKVLDYETCGIKMCQYYNESEGMTDPCAIEDHIQNLKEPGRAEGNFGAGTCDLGHEIDLNGAEDVRTWLYYFGGELDCPEAIGVGGTCLNADWMED